jgi:CelD/BcsL family acetyltransferase involved in cellulose biosynthesis
MTHRVEFRREALPPLAALEREWRMLEAAGRPTFFNSWQWIGTLLGTLPPGSRPKLLRGCVGGETVALALLGANERRRHGLVRSRSLHLNETGDARFDSLTIEHNAILAVAGSEGIVWDELIAWFAGAGDEADELYIGGSRVRLPEEVVEGRGLRRNETTVPSYSVDLRRLEESGGELYPVLSANARQQLRRALRHFEEFGPLHLHEAETESEALRFFASMKALHCASWERRGKAHSFTGAFFEPFHRRLIERGFAEGGIQVLRACAGDRIIGFLYNFRLGNRIYAYQSGFDDGDRRERPGIVTHALAVRHAFRTGAGVYDFMAGRNRLKESFATRCEPMLWQVVQQPRFVFRMEDLARRVKRVLRPERDDTADRFTARPGGESVRREPGASCRSFSPAPPGLSASTLPTRCSSGAIECSASTISTNTMMWR